MRMRRREKGKSSPQDTGEPSPLASLASETTNIRTLFFEGKEDTSERPGDISGKRAEHTLSPAVSRAVSA
jgi:hypothetical protein